MSSVPLKNATSAPGYDIHVHHTLKASGEAWRGALTRALEPLGLTMLQWGVLEGVLTKPGQSQTDLAHRIGLDSPSLVRLLDSLERRGLVERRSSPQDRRVKQLWPKDAALDEAERVQAALGEVYERAFDSLGAERKEALLGLIQEMTRALNA